MTSDKSWIHLKDRLCDVYWDGAKQFLEFAKNHSNKKGPIRYPCKQCVNMKMQKIDVVNSHIIQIGFNPAYILWRYHGEADVVPSTVPTMSANNETIDKMFDVLQDIASVHDDLTDNVIAEDNAAEFNVPDSEFDKMYSYMEKELWPGCSSLSALNFFGEVNAYKSAE